MGTRLWSVVVDARDPAALGHWWGEALGWTVSAEADDEVDVIPPGGEDAAAPGLVFGSVPEPKRGRNRIHLDLASQSSEDQAAIVARLLAAGATRADVGQGDVPWVVLADPEGNELCVLDPRDRYRDAGSLAAVVVHAHDPDALARWWEHAAGWRLAKELPEGASLHRPNDRPPDLDFVRSPAEKRVKNRLHLDVAPGPDDDQQAEVDRLLGLGATRVDVGQVDVPWVVLADPEGNELCVLTPR
jgi:predicted enzyme related to lactoylglutathione lyase